jgi:hypothetical protein
MPNYGGMDIRGQLNANNWFPGGPPPDAGPGGPPVDTSGGPPPGVVPPGIPPQVPPQGPPWQRADQWATQMPTGGPPIPPPGLTGTVPWGDPRYVGMTPSRPAPAAWSQAMPNFGNPQLINPYTFPG